MLVLKSDRLQVQINEPGEAPNTTYRFDRAGFVSEVILDGAHYFCASEPNNLWHPSSGGRGLCSEIIFDASTQADIGEYFPKFGVGLLKKKDEDPYRFYKEYESIPFDISIEAGTDCAVFVTQAMNCLGYAVQQKKQIRVDKNCLEMQMQITNVGEKQIFLREYCHNFLSIDGMAIGPAYELQLPTVMNIPQGDLTSSQGDDNYQGTAKGIRIRKYLDSYATIQFLEQSIAKDRPFQWTLANTAAGASVHCQESFVPKEVAVWCVDHIVSPEVFYDFSLQPEETQTWSRTYHFWPHP